MITFNEFLRNALRLPEQASTFARRLDGLHYAVILTSLAGATFVFSLAAYWIIKYRRRAGMESNVKVPPNRVVEVLYITVPLGIFLLFFFIGFGDYVVLRTPPPGAMVVYVTAKQWMWKFTYPEGPSAINVLTVPAHRPVKLIMTSRDVIHSFFVPAFRQKEDVIPGRYTYTWFEVANPGRYRVFCAEYCGLDHSQMWAEVVALEPAEYDRWMEEQKQGLVARRDVGGSGETPELPRGRYVPPLSEGRREPREPEPISAGNLTLQGRRIAEEKGCINCHTVDGRPHIGPTWLDLYMRKVQLQDGSTVVADEAYLTESMMDPLAKLVAGYDPVMPTYLGQLDAAQTAAIVEFIKSLRSDRLDRAPKTEGPTYAPAR